MCGNCMGSSTNDSLKPEEQGERASQCPFPLGDILNRRAPTMQARMPPVRSHHGEVPCSCHSRHILKAPITPTTPAMRASVAANKSTAL